MKTKIFISYRRSDIGDHIENFVNLLEESLDQVDIFWDNRIIGGDIWQDKLADEIIDSEIILVAIGPNWLNAEDKEGNRRLENENDVVLWEIITALESDPRKIIIPLLFFNTKMPKEKDLPEDIKDLCKSHAESIVAITPDEIEKLKIAIVDKSFKNVVLLKGEQAVPVFSDDCLYLSSIDTTRSRPDERGKDEIQFRSSYAKSDIFQALMFGQRIVITNHHFDSKDFLFAMSDIIEANNHGINLPVLPFKFARLVFENWDNQDPTASEVVANNLDYQNFRLSGWPELDQEEGRRKEWARILRTPNPTIEDLLPYCKTSEEKQAKALLNVLAFFDHFHAKRDQKYFTNSIGMAKVFQNDIGELKKLSEMNLEQLQDSGQIDFKKDIYLGAAKELLNIISETIKAKDVILDINNKDFARTATRSIYYGYISEENGFDPLIVEGIRELIDSIYNKTVSASSQAKLFNNSFVRGNDLSDDRFAQAAQILANWTREMTLKKGFFVYENPEDWNTDIGVYFKNHDDKIVKSVNDIFSWEDILLSYRMLHIRENIYKFNSTLADWKRINKESKTITNDDDKAEYEDRTNKKQKILNDIFSKHYEYLNGVINAEIGDKIISFRDKDGKLKYSHITGEIKFVKDKDTKLPEPDFDSEIIYDGKMGEVSV